MSHFLSFFASDGVPKFLANRKIMSVKKIWVVAAFLIPLGSFADAAGDNTWAILQMVNEYFHEFKYDGSKTRISLYGLSSETDDGLNPIARYLFSSLYGDAEKWIENDSVFYRYALTALPRLLRGDYPATLKDDVGFDSSLLSVPLKLDTAITALGTIDTTIQSVAGVLGGKLDSIETAIKELHFDVPDFNVDLSTIESYLANVDSRFSSLDNRYFHTVGGTFWHFSASGSTNANYFGYLDGISRTQGDFFTIIIEFLSHFETLYLTDNVMHRNILLRLFDILQKFESSDTGEYQDQAEGAISSAENSADSIKEGLKFEGVSVSDSISESLDFTKVWENFGGTTLPSSVNFIFPHMPFTASQTVNLSIPLSDLIYFLDFCNSLFKVFWYVVVAGLGVWVFKLFLPIISKFVKLISVVLQW